MVLKKLWNILLLSNGISTGDGEEREDKWARFRDERRAWEHERDLERAAPDPPVDEAQPTPDRPDQQ